jgi:hypothetical protein
MDLFTILLALLGILLIAGFALRASQRDGGMPQHKRKEYLERWARLTFGKLLASFADGSPVPQQFRGLKRIKGKDDAEHIRAFIDFVLAAKGRNPGRMGWSWHEEEHGAGYVSAQTGLRGTSVTRMAWIDLARSKLTLPW